MKAAPRLSPAPALLPVNPRERLIVALDVPELDEARNLVERLSPTVRWFKVGSELFTSAGPRAVALVLEHGGRVFLDLKFHDIPHTVRGAVGAAVRLGVSMVNVHASGGEAMMRAAVDARGDASAYVIGVTALTSAAEDASRVAEIAQRAREAGLDGVVASPQEVALIKQACGPSFIVVTPGIRPAPVSSDDQRRTATPERAIRAGSDFLVVGRPVLSAADPVDAARRVLDEIIGAEARRAPGSEQ